MIIGSKYEYEPITADQVPERIRFIVPRRNPDNHFQGQIIEFAFGGDGILESGAGDPYMRVVDASVPAEGPRYYRLVGILSW